MKRNWQRWIIICLCTQDPSFFLSLEIRFLSHFYFRKRFCLLSLPFSFPKLVPRSIVNKDTTREFRDSGSFNFGHGHRRLSLSLSRWTVEERPTKAEKIPQRRLQFNLFAVHASLLALNHERQFRSAGGTNFCKQVCLPDPRAPRPGPGATRQGKLNFLLKQKSTRRCKFSCLHHQL